MTSYRLAGASALLLGLLSAVPAMAQESGIPVTLRISTKATG